MFPNAQVAPIGDGQPMKEQEGIQFLVPLKRQSFGLSQYRSEAPQTMDPRHNLTNRPDPKIELLTLTLGQGNRQWFVIMRTEFGFSIEYLLRRDRAADSPRETRQFLHFEHSSDRSSLSRCRNHLVDR